MIDLPHPSGKDRQLSADAESGVVGTGSSEGLLRSGEEALLRGAWREARERFQAVVAAGESVEGLIGLGVAARYLFDAQGALDAHEAAYRLSRDRADARMSARAALELVFDCGLFRGPAEAGGWLERAARLLEEVPDGYERGLLMYLRARFALAGGHDPEAAGRFAREGAEIARVGGAFDGEMVCLALEGLAMVAEGRVAEGMRRLDEATTAAVSGEIRDARVVEVVCCHLIDACARVRDFDRVGEWCRRVEEISSRFDDAEIFATCRTVYGEVLVWQGAWREAERTLKAVCRDFAHVPGKAVDGLARMAELRRRQGRLDDAAALLDQLGQHRLGSVTRAALALDRGDAGGAVALAERFLRGVGDRDRFERVQALEVLVRARLALGARDQAEAAACELEEIAARAGTRPLRAAALLARGRVERGRDLDRASVALEDAAGLFGESGLRYESALAGLELAGLLGELGREREADSAEQSARAELADLGTVMPGRARRVGSAGRPDGLTRREREVLRLMAHGLSNEEIAGQLVLSVRTVEHHVTSIYSKIGASGRAARAAATAYAIANGLTSN